jgi:hypothetical protein
LICFFSSLKYDSAGTLEQFFAHDGCSALLDTIAKVPGVLNGDDDAMTIYNVACGAAQYIRHYLGIRKRGPNVMLKVTTSAGANDSFLEVAPTA